MADPLRLADLDLANHQGESWTKNIRGGVLSSLAPSAPDIKVGETDHFTFTGTPKAELVGESQPKNSQDRKPGKVTAKTYKVQLTYRMSNEVQWEDEDYQTGVVDDLVASIAIGLNRALDLIAIHGVNPATGEVATQVSDYFTKAGNGIGTVTAGEKPDLDIEQLAAKLQGQGYIATGIGFDPSYAGALARSRDANGNKQYPELGLGFGFTNFQGLAAASSDTVSGRQELDAADATLRAIMGDFRAFKWGVARQIPLKLIEYGDPDGNGDLQRTNEVAIRAESVLGFAIFDYKAFAIVEGAPLS